MAVVSMKQLIEAGVHYGHQTRRWNPKMKPFIFGAKHGIHIIDLQKSLRMLKDSYEFVRDLSARGESVLFVGTKLQAREIVREEARRSNSFYVNVRWLGGMLTNFNTVKQSIGHMKKLEEQRGENGMYEGIIKKEAMRMEKKLIKLEKALGGIKEMRKLPGAVFVIDCRRERIAVQESQKLGVPIVAVVDTNCDPDNIDHIIPGNDDAIRAIHMFCSVISNAVLEGRAIYEAQARTVEEEKPKAKRPARAAREAGKPDAGEAPSGAPAEPEAPAAMEAQTPAGEAPTPADASPMPAAVTPVAAEAEGKAEGITKEKPAAKAPAKTEKKAAAKPKAEDKSEDKSEAKAEVKGEDKTEAKAEVKGEDKSEAKAEAKGEGKPETKTEAKAEAKGGEKPETKTETEAKAEAKGEGKPGEKGEPEASGGKEASADAAPAAASEEAGEPAQS